MRLSILLLIFPFFAANGQWLNYPTPNVPKTPDGKPNLSAPAPRTADGKPDFTGLWEMVQDDLIQPTGIGCLPVRREFVNIGTYLPGGLLYQPLTPALIKTRGTEGRIHDPISNGLPIGLVRLHTYPGPRKMIQIPGLLVILNEPNASFRQIFTDGRPPVTDPNPTWNGYSTGKWDGDVLVVQTNGFRDGTWLDSVGNPLTEAATITERFRRPNFGQLEIELTVDDPKAYTKPWTVKLNQTIRLDTDLLDYVVNENEKDLQHIAPTQSEIDRNSEGRRKDWTADCQAPGSSRGALITRDESRSVYQSNLPPGCAETISFRHRLKAVELSSGECSNEAVPKHFQKCFSARYLAADSRLMPDPSMAEGSNREHTGGMVAIKVRNASRLGSQT